MGCDIHMYVEKFENDEWAVMPTINYQKQRYFEGFQNAKNESDARNWIQRCSNIKSEILGEEFYYGRNYTLFAILADVRNYEEIPIMSEPRGIPRDTCEFIRNERSSWGSDAHSLSYFYLNELLTYDWGVYRTSCIEFIKTIENLSMEVEDTSKVRLVFWFDN